MTKLVYSRGPHVDFSRSLPWRILSKCFSYIQTWKYRRIKILIIQWQLN